MLFEGIYLKSHVFEGVERPTTNTREGFSDEPEATTMAPARATQNPTATRKS
jgi:hypothetical protein